MRASRSTASSSCSRAGSFSVEDHYCANPECDCQNVHLEFWERVHEFYPKRRINIRQRLMATFTLTGELTETRFSQESASTTKHLLLAWIRRGSAHFHECRRRYAQVKVVGVRSFPPLPDPDPAPGVVIDQGVAAGYTHLAHRLQAACTAERSVSLWQRFEVQTVLRAACCRHRLPPHRNSRRPSVATKAWRRGVPLSLRYRDS